MGDAINWEWIVFCAKTYGKDIIIVTRDMDYGIQHEGKFFLNDWLSQEFKERVSRKRKVVLTDKLSEAFELVRIKINKKVEEEEAQLIKEITAFIRTQFSELTAGSGTTGTTPENRNLALPSPSE